MGMRRKGEGVGRSRKGGGSGEWVWEEEEGGRKGEWWVNMGKNG